MCAANPTRCKKALQLECSEFWKSIKAKESFAELLAVKMDELKRQVKKFKERNFRFFTSVPKSTSPGDNGPRKRRSDSTDVADLGAESKLDKLESSGSDAKENLLSTGSHLCASTPKQDEIRKQLEIVNADLAGLAVRKDNEMLSADQCIQMKQLKKDKLQLEKDLGKLMKGRERQHKYRQRQKRERDEVMDNDPVKASKLRCHQSPGRPPLQDQDQIMKAIIDIAQYGAAAQQKRRFDELRTVKTLDELVDSLK